MLRPLLFTVLWFASRQWAVAADKPGFLLTAPRALVPGMNETLVVNIVHPPNKGQVIVRLVGPDNQILSETSLKSAGGGPEGLSLEVPQLLPLGSKMAVLGKFGRYSFEKTLPVKVETGPGRFVIIVQTDKPVYKAEELVRFRILGVDVRSLPFTEDTVGEVWVENPSALRVMQWHNVSFSNGMVQLEMELSNEPQLGEWKVCCRLKGEETRSAFRVDQYVLPRFSVEIEPPPFVFPKDSNTTWKICARYLYGKPVEGHLRAQLTYKRFAWPSEAGKVLPSFDLDLPVKGCHEFWVDGGQLLLTNRDLNRRPLVLTATVTEAGTDVVESANITVHFTWSRLTLKFLSRGSVPNFKPGLVYRGRVVVKHPDGSPASKERVRVCFTASNETMAESAKGCRVFESGQDGLVHFSVPGLRGSPASLTLTAHADGSPWRDPAARLHLRAWKSLSQRHLLIQDPGVKLSCNTTIPITFSYTNLKKHPNVLFNYQVFLGRHAVEHGSFSPRSSRDDNVDRIRVESGGWETHGFSVAELDLKPKPNWGLSSRVHLLIYYAHPNGEVIADALSLRLEPCVQNLVSLSFAKRSAYPGTPVNLFLGAAQGSVCGIWASDQGVLQKEPSARFTQEHLQNMLDPLEPKPSPLKVANGHCQPQEQGWFLGEPTPFLDAAAAFEESTVQVITDLKLDVRPCDPTTLWRSGSPERPMPLSGGSIKGELVPRRSEGQPDTVASDDPPKAAVSLRTHFPETWLWEMHHMKGDTPLSLNRELPHSVTRWQAGALCVHASRGLAVAGAVLDALQPFFIQLILPPSAKRGELIPVSASVFSYLETSVPLKLSISADAGCLKLLGETQQTFCLHGGGSVVLKVQARPLCLGLVNITVHALGTSGSGPCGPSAALEPRQARDSLQRSLRVRAEGLPRQKSISKYVCLNGSQGGAQNHEFHMEVPSNIVPGSSRGTFTTSGDLISAVLASGLKQLVQLPTGCGEQNLALLAANVFTLEYLASSGQSGHPLERQLKENIIKGYQRQLNYKHPKGGYSAFGAPDAEPSLWLTAFVIRTLGPRRSFVAADRHEIQSSILWVLGNQYENGCFPSIGRVLNSKLKGGLEGRSLAPLTAYVLLSLLEVGTELPESSRNGAAACLLQELPQQQDSYTLALSTYALALLGHDQARTLLASLWSQGQPGSGETFHWSKNASLAVAVETAGYAILASLKLEGRVAANRLLPVVRWMLEQRNHNGGFVSTQDTVVALQALAEYAEAVGSARGQLTLKLTGPGINAALAVNQSNALLTQELPVPTLPSVLHLEATGLGCALLQATVKYNTRAGAQTKNFDLMVASSHSSTCQPRLRVCASYMSSWAMSGMVIIQIEMQSGFVFQKLQESLEVKRHEVQQDRVNLYFEELSNRKTCTVLELLREHVVEDAAPAVVILRDYYEPSVIVTTNYTVPIAPCDGGRYLETGQTARTAGARFHNFRNVEHDLDFPEGPEANAPVVVSAPPLPSEEHSVCPRCWDSFPANFTAMYCAARLVLLATRDNSSMGRMLWITSNLSSQLNRPVAVERAASYDLKECTCPALAAGKGNLLILSRSSTILSNGPKMLKLTLSGNVDLVWLPMSSEVTQHQQLKKARQECILNSQRTVSA